MNEGVLQSYSGSFDECLARSNKRSTLWGQTFSKKKSEEKTLKNQSNGPSLQGNLFFHK